jgi:hypothetical protein
MQNLCCSKPVAKASRPLNKSPTMAESTHNTSDDQPSMDCEMYRLLHNSSNGTLSDGVTAGNRDNETLLLMRHQPVDGYQGYKAENNDQESLLNSWSVPHDSHAGSVWTHDHSPLPFHNAAQPHISSRHVPDDMSAGDITNGCKSSLVCSLLFRLRLMLRSM